MSGNEAGLTPRSYVLQESRMAVKDVSVVLAHGAWADGSSWARVITALKAEGAKRVSGAASADLSCRRRGRP